MRRKKHDLDLLFEEAVGDNLSRDLDVAEIALDNRPFFYVSVILGLIVCAVVVRILWLGVVQGPWYEARASANMNRIEKLAAPRGIIEDRNGVVLAENNAVFFAVLNVREFLRNQEFQAPTLHAVQEILAIPEKEITLMIENAGEDRLGEPIVLNTQLTQKQIVDLSSFELPTLSVIPGFERKYISGPIFSHVIGYTGYPNEETLSERPELSASDEVGKAGIEYQYDSELRGEPGKVVLLRDSRGRVLEEEQKGNAKIGKTLRLTIDAELQKYIYNRLQSGLRSLGRQSGAGIAMNPKTGEVLALVSLPGFDNNFFASPGHNEERRNLLTSKSKPMFNRVISGVYSPGSTIKPLVGVAALEEGVVNAEKKIYSPGYLEVPNRYDPSKPSRFVDWRPQGWVDLSSALAQSSNVYFYLVAGGSPQQIPGSRAIEGQEGIRGLGITRLHEWWRKFGLGSLTHIDLPGEAVGLLPAPESKEKNTGTPWLLGDTYNVSIGQGDLLITPIQLLNYINVVANNGVAYVPRVALKNEPSEILIDLSALSSEIKEAQKGMNEAAEAPLGTAYQFFHDLPFEVGAKTGTAQIMFNTQANAFFVGYAPFENPEISILILVENAVEGSLNTVPIAKDVLNWYYENRIK